MVVRELITQWGFKVDFKQLDKLDRRLDDTKRKTKKIGEGFGNMAKRAQGFGVAFSAATTLPITLFGLAALRTAGQFEKAMNRVAALKELDQTSEQFKELNALARELGRTTQFTATQTAEAMGFLAQAGLTTTEIIKAIPSALRLAGAAQLDFATTADVVTNVMKGMGIEADDLGDTVDILTKTFVSSNTDLSQLGQAMKFAGPVARGFNLTLTDTTSILGLMGNAGIQASLAGTSLRGALVRLASPSKEAGKILRSLGLSVEQSNPSVRNFIDILADLEKAGITTTQVMEVFGLRAGPAISTLLASGVKEIRKFNKTLGDAGGIADRIQKTQLKGLFGQLTKLNSAWGEFQITIVESVFGTSVAELLKSFTSFIRILAELNPNILRFTGILLGVISVLGPLLFLVATGALVFKALGLAALFAGKSFLFIPLVITLVLLLLALLIDDIVAFARGQKSVIGDIVGAWEPLGEIIFLIIERIKNLIKLSKELSPLGLLNKIGADLGKAVFDLTHDVKVPRSIADGNAGFGTNEQLAVATGAASSKGIVSNRTLTVNSSITVAVPQGTPAQQSEFVRESAKEAVKEEWQNILDLAGNEITETE